MVKLFPVLVQMKELSNFGTLKNGKLLNTISGHTNYSRAVVFSPDGQFLATTVMADDTVNIRNVKTGEISSFTKKGTHNVLTPSHTHKTEKYWHQEVITDKLYFGI